MAYLFPYAGSERASLPPRVRLKPQQKVEPMKPAPDIKQDNRPIELPVMPEALRKILLEVCEHHNVHPNDVASTSHAAKFVYARRHYIVRARTETEHSFPRIARAIRKDHTSAVHAYAQWRKEGAKTIAVWKPPVRTRRPGPRAEKDPYEFTPSETAVMEMVKQGKSFEEIAEARNIRIKTARMFYTDGLRKLRKKREAQGELV